MSNTYSAIQKVTVGSSGLAEIEFVNIPAAYDDLVLRYSLRTDEATDQTFAFLQINSSSNSIYSFQLLYLDNDAVGASRSLLQTKLNGNITTGSTTTESTFSNGELYIANYRKPVDKPMSIDAVSEKYATTNVGIYMAAGVWENSSYISSLKLYNNGLTKFVQHSTATLYGIKNTV